MQTGADIKAVFTRFVTARNTVQEVVKKEGYDFMEICASMKIQARGGAGVDSAGGDVWDMSNSDRLGVSEVDLVNLMIKGCNNLVKAEQALEKGEFIYEFMPGLGDEEYPGFPHDVCPDTIPDLKNHNSIMADVLKKDPSIYYDL